MPSHVIIVLTLFTHDPPTPPLPFQTFMADVRIMLKNNPARIRQFQLETDNFRNGVLSAKEYYEYLESAFVLGAGGASQLDRVITPLVDSLPDQSKRCAWGTAIPLAKFRFRRLDVN